MNTPKLSVFLLIIFVLQSCGNKKTEYDATGTFEATEVIVSAETAGKLQQWDVTEGLKVSPGTVLGYVDTTHLALKKKELFATLDASKSRYTDVPKQIAAIKQEISNSERELQRFQKLVEAKAGNQKQVDDIKYKIADLNKELVAKQSLIESGNQAISNESVALSVQIDEVQDMLNKSVIKSPIEGTILTKYAELGELVTPGKALFKVADMEHIFLRSYVTSEQLSQIKLNQTVKVFADFGNDTKKEYEGTVTWISDESEFTPKSIQTDDDRANLVYATKIAVKNDGFIKRGMYGEVKFQNQ
ncbi:MAG: HlyD family secretion protein [Dysgonomonas sp.]